MTFMSIFITVCYGKCFISFDAVSSRYSWAINYQLLSHVSFHFHFRLHTSAMQDLHKTRIQLCKEQPKPRFRSRPTSKKMIVKHFRLIAVCIILQWDKHVLFHSIFLTYLNILPPHSSCKSSAGLFKVARIIM